MNSKDLGITLSEKQHRQFQLYYEFLLQENKKYNLTAITEKEEVYIKHFYDSLTLMNTGLIKEGITLCDIGSGAGFPSIPLKIANPTIHVTIVESQTKKTRFLTQLVDYLGLDNVTVVNARAEDYAHSQYFDVVTARAVAHLSILNELCIPFVKKGGHFIAMKATYQTELNDSLKGIKQLGGVLDKVMSLQLPHQIGERHLILIKKTDMVKGYPRPFAQIKKNPL